MGVTPPGNGSGRPPRLRAVDFQAIQAAQAGKAEFAREFYPQLAVRGNITVLGAAGDNITSYLVQVYPQGTPIALVDIRPIEKPPYGNVTMHKTTFLAYAAQHLQSAALVLSVAPRGFGIDQWAEAARVLLVPGGEFRAICDNDAIAKALAAALEDAGMDRPTINSFPVAYAPPSIALSYPLDPSVYVVGAEKPYCEKPAIPDLNLPRHLEGQFARALTMMEPVTEPVRDWPYWSQRIDDTIYNGFVWGLRLVFFPFLWSEWFGVLCTGRWTDEASVPLTYGKREQLREQIDAQVYGPDSPTTRVIERDLSGAAFYTVLHSPAGLMEEWIGSVINGLRPGTQLRYLGIGIGRGNVEYELKRLFGNDIAIDAFSYNPMDHKDEMGPALWNARKGLFNKVLPAGDINDANLPRNTYHRILAVYSTFYALDQADVVQKLYDALLPGGEAFFVVDNSNSKAAEIFGLLRAYPAIFRAHGFDIVALRDHTNYVPDGYVTMKKRRVSGDFSAALEEARVVDRIAHYFANQPKALNSFLSNYKDADGKAIDLRPRYRLAMDDEPEEMDTEALRESIRSEIRRYMVMGDPVESLTDVAMSGAYLADLAAGLPIKALVWRLLVPRDMNTAKWYTTPNQISTASGRVRITF